jgi:hypothetical protein
MHYIEDDLITGDYAGQATCPRVLPASEVLDLHSDLHSLLTRPDADTRRIMLSYAHREGDDFPQWTASHFHPAASMRELDPWLASLGSDLAGADTYQITAEMISLAEALRAGTPDLDVLREEDLPSDSGFMWLDRPVPRPSFEDDEEHPPLLMHAVSWHRTAGKLPIRLTVDGAPTMFTTELPAVRIREWGYNASPDIVPRPLHLMGQSTALLAGEIRTPLSELQVIHMLWILMGMKITSSAPQQASRAARKRAAALGRTDVRVVTLRRAQRGGDKPSATPKTIDWTCTWLVRGHHRAAPHGGTFRDGRERTWIDPYIKGPDGLPLKSADILYRLSR